MVLFIIEQIMHVHVFAKLINDGRTNLTFEAVNRLHNYTVLFEDTLEVN